MKWMYFFGDDSKWYFNWVLFLFAFGICFPFALYMLYRTVKDISATAAKNDKLKSHEELCKHYLEQDKQRE